MNNKNIILILVGLLVVGLLSWYFFVSKNNTVSEEVAKVDFSGTLVVDDQGISTFNAQNLVNSLALMEKSDLSEEEKAGLVYMREEEKLAHDVYSVLYNKFSQNVYNNIASSEMTHTDAVKSLLERYELTDPSLNKGVGEFENADLKSLYVELLNKANTIKDALEVGAAIEEIDILDLQERIAQTDNEDIKAVYEMLMKGSRNHLRAFTKNYKNLTGEDYVPQYLSQVDYDTIVNADIERGGGSTGGNGRGRR